jgi:membrane carboxypeptidase/penicillin-binding protein PbpC
MQFTAEVNPPEAANKVVWKVSNTSLATVDANGLLTANSRNTGQATLTASLLDSKVSYSIIVQIIPGIVTKPIPDGDDVLYIKIDQVSGISVLLGEQQQFSVTLNAGAPTAGLVWKVSNTALATVNADGLLTANARTAGTITLTVTAPNGRSYSIPVRIVK